MLVFIGLVITILLTPGPTNTLLASAGAQLGFRAARGLILVELMGYISAITFWGYFIQAIAVLMPSLPNLIKLISAFYILYLALKLWRTARAHVALSQCIGRHELFIATLLNPKGLLFASVIFPSQIWQDLNSFSLYLALFSVLLVPIASFWIFLGSLLKSSQGRWFSQQRLQKVAAIILLCFAVPLSYSAAHAL